MRSFVLLVSGTAAAAVFSLSASVMAQGYLPPQQQQQQQAPPPPQNAIAPNGEYVAPLQQQTQQTYVPQSVALSGPRLIKDWNDGDPIPPGYHPANRVRGGLLGGGIGLFGATWLISALVAAFDQGSQSCSTTGYPNYSYTCTPTEHQFWPLWIPVVGPFIAIGTTHADTGGGFVLVLDGLAQAGGIAMMIAGAVGHTVLVRNDLGKPMLEWQPLTGMGASHTGNGMGLKLNF